MRWNLEGSGIFGVNIVGFCLEKLKFEKFVASFKIVTVTRLSVTTPWFEHSFDGAHSLS